MKRKALFGLAALVLIALGAYLITNVVVAKEGQAVITLKQGASVEREQLAKALEGTHFTVKEVKATAEGKLVCTIEGMKCGGCPPQVEAAFNKVDGVESVKAELLQ